MILLAFAISAAIGALGGIAITPISSTSYLSGGIYALSGFVAAILGGWGSSAGAVVGGLALGIIQSLVTGFLPAGYQDAIAYAILILVLYFRPSGLLGASGRGEGSRGTVRSQFSGARAGLLFKTLLVVILLVWPLLYHSGYAMRIMTTAGLFAIITIAVVIILGQAGQLSFGHSAFYGIGAYTAALLVMKLSLPRFRPLSSGRWSRVSSPSSSAGRCSSCATSIWPWPPSGWARSSWCW